MASSRPQTAGAALTTTSGSSAIWRRISIVALVALALAFVPAVAVAAEEPTSGYSTTPTTTTKTNTTPSQGVEPSKEAEKPTTSTPASEPTTSTAPSSEKASTLPFTGFDLRWDIGFGLLLMIAGFSIVVLQRRQRRERGH
jgi:hypothetical protein